MHPLARLAAPALAIAAALGLAASAPAAAAIGLAQKPGAAGCIGSDPPCAAGVGIGINTTEVQVSPDGRNAYAVSVLNGVLTVLDRATDGTLKQKDRPAGCLSKIGNFLPGFCSEGRALEGAFGVAISPDGRNVYAAAIGSNAVVILDRAADGTLTQKPGVAGCISEFPGGTCADGAGLRAAYAVMVSPDGENVYVGGEGGALAAFDRARDGALTQKAGRAACVSATATAPCASGRAISTVGALASSPDGTNVYTASGDGVAVFDRRSDGRLVQKRGLPGCISDTSNGGVCAYGKALRFPTGVAVSADGASVYVSAAGSAAVAVFDRGAGGALTSKPGAAGCISGADTRGLCATARGLKEARTVTVSSDGRSVLVGSRTTQNFGGLIFDGPGYVATFDRAASGTLKQPAGATACVSDAKSAECGAGVGLRDPSSVTVSPDGRNTYVSAFGGGLAILDRLGAPARDVRRPVLTGLALAPASFRAAASTRISYRLSELSTVSFTVQRVLSGHRYRDVPGSVSATAAKGRHALRLSSRMLDRPLGVGRYRLRAVARDPAGNRSRAASSRFKIRR